MQSTIYHIIVLIYSTYIVLSTIYVFIYNRRGNGYGITYVNQLIELSVNIATTIKSDERSAKLDVILMTKYDNDLVFYTLTGKWYISHTFSGY